MHITNISVIIPFYNEAGNVIPLVQEIQDALYPLISFEIILVDDGSKDETYKDIQYCQQNYKNIKSVRHKNRYGQSAALRSGAKVVCYPWIVTLDGDGQNDPADIVILLKTFGVANSGSKMVIFGNRFRRHDNWLRRVSSIGANLIRRLILGDQCPDSGCALKLFPREGFLDLPFFDHMHRFLPALFQYYGHRVVNVSVGHRPRSQGNSKYTFWGRFLDGFFDLLGVLWLKRRTKVVLVDEALVEENHRNEMPSKVQL